MSLSHDADGDLQPVHIARFFGIIPSFACTMWRPTHSSTKQVRTLAFLTFIPCAVYTQACLSGRVQL